MVSVFYEVYRRGPSDPHRSKCVMCKWPVNAQADGCCQGCHWLICSECGHHWCTLPFEMQSKYKRRSAKRCSCRAAYSASVAGGFVVCKVGCHGFERTGR
jgi:hypothetical protein